MGLGLVFLLVFVFVLALAVVRVTVSGTLAMFAVFTAPATGGRVGNLTG
jgi:hypothetical protein